MLFKVGSTAILVFLLASFASSQVVTYTTFDPGDSYDDQGWYQLAGRSLPNLFDLALQFTATETGGLHSIRIAGFWIEGDTNIGLVLHDGNSNEIGGEIANLTYTNSSPTPVISTVVQPGSGPLITAGSRYWLHMYLPTDGIQGWSLANGVHLGRMGYTPNGGEDWFYSDSVRQGACEVNVVPEPGTWIALTLGVAALTRRPKRASGAEEQRPI